MAENNFYLKLQGELDKVKSQVGITQDIKDIEKQIESLKIKAELDEKSVQNIIKQLNNVLNQKVTVGNDIGNGIQKSVEASLKQTKKLIGDTIKNLPSVESNEKQLLNFDARRAKILQQISTYLSKNSKLTTTNTEEARELQGRFEQIRQEVQSISRGDNTGLSILSKQLSTAKLKAKELKLEGNSLSEELGRLFKRFNSWFSVGQLSFAFTDKIHEAITEIKDLDSILTEISKTSDLTTSQLNELGDSAFETASKYGKSASDYLTGIQEMYRSGFDNAEQMAELSVLAQTAGDMNAEMANNYLIATNSAYKLKGNVEALNAVLDGQNYITNNAAVNMNDMGEATSKAASIAAQSGVKINELSALIATGVAQTKKSGDEVGTAIKSVFVNLQNTQSDKIVKTFDSVGISMTKIENGAERLKTPIELIKELADVYNSLEEGSPLRANIVTNLAGKYQANVFAGILSGIDDYDRMIKLYSEGSGSAMIEAQKSAANLESALNRINNTITDIVDNVLGSQLLTDSANGLNDILGLVNQLTDKLGTLGTISVIGAGIVGANKKSSFNLSNIIAQYKDLNTTVTKYNTLTSNVNFSAEKFNASLKNNNTMMGKYLRSLNGANASIGGYIKYLATAKASTLALSAATTTMNMAISMGTAYLVSTAITALADFAHRAEEAREKSTELSNAWKEDNSSLSDTISQYKELNEKLNDNSLTTEEVKSIKEQLTSIQDDLNQKYGEEANNIDIVNGKYDEQIAKLDELSKKKAQDYVATNADNVKADKEYLSKVISGDNTTDIARYQTNLGNDEQEKQYKEAEKIYKKYLKKFEALSLSYDYFKGTTGLRLNLKGTREEIQTQLSQLFSELNEDYKGNPPEFIQGLKDVITETLNMDDFDTTKIEDAKNNIKAYTEAEILANSKTRNLYNDSIDAVEKYNNALAEGKGINAAKKNLDDIKQKVSESIKGYEGYDAVFNDIFDAARETDNKIKEVTEQTSILSKSFSSVFNSEDYKEVSQELLKLAEAGELNPNVLDGVSKYTSLLEETGLTAQQASDRINKMVDSTTRLAATTSNISKLSEAYKEFQENGHNSMNSLSELQSAFGKLDGYDDFIKVAGSASSSAKDIQKAYNNLCSEYINGTGILDTVNKSNKDLIKTQLEAVGVTNAETIVNNALNKGMTELNTNTLSLNDAKRILLNNSLKLATVTAQEIQGLINEGIVSRDTTEKIALFALKKQLANGITINTIGDIQALAKLANVAQKTINLMDGVAKLQKLIDSGQIYGSAAESYKHSIQTDLNSINDEVNKKIGQNAQINTATISSVPNTSGSKGNSKGSGSSKKKKEPIDKFNDWLNKLFDFMEIKLSKQESKIEKYANRAENAMDKGNYSKSAINYRNAIKATNVQIDNEGDAQKLYNSTANKVLKKAVSLGVINQDKAKQIVKDVNNGSVAVKKYSKNVQAVVDAYKQWKDKADSAKDSLSDLTDKTRGYAKSLKELRDTQRDAKIAKIDNSTSFIGAFGSNQYSAKSQNAQLSFEISKLNANSKAYNTEVNTVKSDIKKSSSPLLSSLSKKIQKNKKKSEYVKALKRAKNNIKSMKKVSSSDLKIIKKYSASTYNNVLSYNMQLDNLETAKEERNLAVALNKSQIYDKIAEKYDNISAEHDNNISLYEKRMSNSNNAGEIQSNAQAILNEMNAKDTNRQNEINSYNNTISSSKTSIASLVGVNSKLKGKAYATVKALVDRIKSCVSSGTSISDADLNSLNTYANKGYISIQFLDAATNYQMALIRKEEAVVEDMMQDEEDKAKRAELGNMMFNASKIATQNALDNNENRRSLLQSQQAYKTGSGLKLSASDYDNLISINNQDVVTYGIQKAAMIAARDYNVASGLWAVGDENWTNASKTIDQLDTSIQNLTNDTQELNNTKLNLQIENQKEYIETLEIVEDFYDSFLEVAEASGKTLSEADYSQSIEALKNSKKEYENLRKTYGEYYNLALNNGGTYAGKSANEWADLYNQAVANKNKKEVEIQNLHDQAWRANLTIYEKVNEEIERTKSLLEGVKSLLDSDTFVNKDGKLTDFGKVDLALGMKEFNENIKAMENARAKYEEIQRGYANKTDSYAYMSEDEYKEVLNKASQELLNYYSDNKSIVSNAYSTIQSVMQAELDALKKVIDKRKEALQAKKDYYDYDKTIKNKTKDIQSLQSQIDALAGIDGAEAKSKMAQLKAELTDKQSDFEDTIQEHTYNLQVNSLDELSETLQDDLDARLELLKTDFAEIIKLAGDLSASQSVTNSVLSNILTTLGGNENDGNKIGVTDTSDSNKTIQSSKKTLSSLKKVDSLVPIDDMKSLVDLNTMTMDLYSLQHTMPKFEPVERNNVTTINYGDLIVEGNVDKYVVDDLKKLYEDSYKYTTQKMYAEARKTGRC